MRQVTDNQRLAGGGFNLPSGFVGLLNAQALALLRGPHLQDLLGKFTHQVTARNPHRQLQHLQFRRVSDRERDRPEMRVQVVYSYAVMHSG